MIKIIPAIDLIGGRCVRLSQGDYSQKKVYSGDPAEIARRYAGCGVKRIHLVDLDGAKAGSPVNLRTLEKIASAVSCELEWGGGISTSEALEAVFDAGATHSIAGSIAALQPDLFGEWLSKYGPRMILGADVRDGRVAVRGWQETAPLGVEDLVERFLPFGLNECIVTDISRDGMLQGAASELYVRLQESFPNLSFTVSGGISSMEDIRLLDSLGLRSVIVGKAIYENRITLEEISQWSQNA
ncbi:MAG: 1-(5-phosphoribosyl)-5-[(5-phosphoribosylamino)methylideneamino]imidazole-4-carboxamide isomerase [Bacteroidales bacterium]|nr:1-(5-phosphoribosyl)-5-[(5-phosphoribosylamino)methylideneamino]imidazole-4-carboxamide isomerase [Bacteroidales bacterium]